MHLYFLTRLRFQHTRENLPRTIPIITYGVMQAYKVEPVTYVALADLWTLSRSTIIVVCRGRDMILEMLPECSKTKSKRVVLADCI
jgi:hypothetical protein